MNNDSHRRDEPEGQGNESLQPNTSQGGDEVLGTLGGLNKAPVLGQGGTSPDSMTQGGSGDPMSDLLGALLGGAGAGDSVPAMGEQGGDLGSILGGLMGGAGAQGGMPQGGSGDPMSDLLGSLFGGGSGGAPAIGEQGDAMGGLLGGLLGGMMGGNMSGAQPGMGAMGSVGGLNSILAPLADQLAAKTGIPPQLAMTVMGIVIPLVINKLMSSGQQSGDLLGSLGSMQQQGLTFTSHEQNEMISQLSAQTGMDPQAAANTLNQAMQVLGSQP